MKSARERPFKKRGAFTKQIFESSPRFFSGRPLIDDKLAPRFFYQDDNLRGDKISLAEVIEQEPLPSGLSAQLDLELRHVVDVCNILKLAETTRDFLRVTGGDRHESLFKRMKKLRLAPTADVTQHLNQCGLWKGLLRGRRQLGTRARAGSL